MRTLTVIVLSLLMTSPVWAKIYKHVDKDGNITYTDVPTSTRDKQVNEEPMTTYEPTAPATATPEPNTKADKAKKTENYDSLNVVSPQDKSIIRANSGTISVGVQSFPGLNTAAGHQYVIMIDGEAQPPSQSNSISVSNLSRGEHSLSVDIQDKDGNVLISSNAVQITILRTSALHHPH